MGKTNNAIAITGVALTTGLVISENFELALSSSVIFGLATIFEKINKPPKKRRPPPNESDNDNEGGLPIIIPPNLPDTSPSHGKVLNDIYKQMAEGRYDKTIRPGTYKTIKRFSQQNTLTQS